MEKTISIEPSTNRRPDIISPKTREWKSCCFSINQSATKYFVQVSVLIGLIIFSAVNLILDKKVV